MMVWQSKTMMIVAKNASCPTRKKGKTKNCVPVADRYHILYMFYTTMLENNAKLPFRNFPVSFCWRGIPIFDMTMTVSFKKMLGR